MIRYKCAKCYYMIPEDLLADHSRKCGIGLELCEVCGTYQYPHFNHLCEDLEKLEHVKVEMNMSEEITFPNESMKITVQPQSFEADISDLFLDTVRRLKEIKAGEARFTIEHTSFGGPEGHKTIRFTHDARSFENSDEEIEE